MPKRLKVDWLKRPEAHDYPAAEAYLRLIYDEAKAKKIVAKLKRAPMTEFKSNDMFRAARLPLLPLSDSHVKKDEKRIIAREDLSPLLLVRDPANGIVIIADGYHRLCAVYAFDEEAVIPCKIV